MDSEGEEEFNSLLGGPRLGEEECGEGGVRCFPFRFEVEGETLLGGSESASDTSGFFEGGV